MDSSVPQEDVLALWNFHVATSSSTVTFAMSEEPVSPCNKKKMKYKYDKYQNSIPPTQVTSSVDEILDTEIGHVDMFEFIQRINTTTKPEMAILVESNIHLVSTFPVAALEPEFVLACASHFDYNSRTIRDDDGNVIITLDPETIDKIFKVPPSPVYADITKEKALERWNDTKRDCIKFMNDNWLVSKRTCLSRWPKMYGIDFIEEINDLITLLSRIMGLRESNVFENWMYEFISLIVRSRQQIFWGEIISDALCEQLAQVPTTYTFYMNSYLVYIAASLRPFSGLSSQGDRSLVPVWEYYEQLTLKSSKVHYKRVQDAFYGYYMCLFDKTLLKRRVSDEAWNKVNEYGCLFLQFPTFTYMRVGCFDDEPYMLPRYPTDRIILMELARQLMAVQAYQSNQHKAGIGISTQNPLQIGRYALNTSPKAKCMETELQEIKLTKFKLRKNFDYRGMNNKIKRAFIHIHRLEDIWIDLRTEDDIRRMDYCRLTLKQIIDLNLTKIPEGAEDDEDILDLEYHEQHIEKLPITPIQWSLKESISIYDRFQSILANTNAWLKQRGIKTIKIKPGKDFDTLGPIEHRSEIRAKTKEGASLSTVIGTTKLKIKGDKVLICPSEEVVLTERDIAQERIQIVASEDELQEGHTPEASFTLSREMIPAIPVTVSVLDEVPMSPLDPDVDSFSTVCVPPVNSSMVPISKDQYDSLENVFFAYPSLSDVSVPLLDTSVVNFDRFMAEASQSTQPLVAIQTEAPPIMTTVVQSKSVSTLATTALAQSVSFSLPPWLSAITPKRKKQEVMLDDFDFQQLKRTKPRVSKKAKTLSRVVVDQSKMKYAELAEPLVDTPQDELLASDYRITKVELGKKTHSGFKNDAQDSVAMLAQSYDQLWAKKNRLKDEKARLLVVIQKITNASEKVNPITSSISEESIRQAEKMGEKAKAVDDWASQMINQGTQLLRDAFRVLIHARVTTSKLNEVLATFSQDLKALEEDLKVWNKFSEIDLDVLCEYGVISSREMYIEYEALMVNKGQVIERLVTDLKVAIETCEEKERVINKGFEELSCKLISENNELVLEDTALSELLLMIHLELEADHFTLNSMDKLVSFKFSLDHLQGVLEENNKVISKCADTVIKTTVVARHTGVPDPGAVHESIRRFETFRDDL